MPREGADLGPGRRVPELRGAVLTPRQDLRPVGREGDGADIQVCPEKMRISVPVAASQSFAVKSRLPVRIFVPSGEKATEKTGRPVCEKVRISAPVAASQSFAVAS